MFEIFEKEENQNTWKKALSQTTYMPRKKLQQLDPDETQVFFGLYKAVFHFNRIVAKCIVFFCFVSIILSSVLPDCSQNSEIH